MRELIFLTCLIGVLHSASAQAIILRDEISNGDFILYVKNNLPCPSLVTANPDSMDQQFQEYIPKDAERVLIRLPIDSLENTQDFQGQIRYSLLLGNPNAIPDHNYLYLLPYPSGDTHTLIQGNNSSFTHHGEGSQYAFDFEMPEGSPVTAIRGGVVGYVRVTHKEGGKDEVFKQKGNQILVCHDDGTIATYGHLKYQGSLVKIGDPVFAGQTIGLSGNTGYSTTPHLHLVVMSGTKSIPIQFRNLPDPLIEGQSYRQVFEY